MDIDIAAADTTMPTIFVPTTNLKPGRCVALAGLLAASLCLTGCVSLLGKSQAQTAATAAPVADPAEPDAKPVRTAATETNPSTKRPGASYVDPMVAAANRGKPPRGELPLRTPAGAVPVASAPAASAPQRAAAARSTAAPSANSLDEVVTQSTGLNANQNSIFALANNQAAASAGDSSIPAYAPAHRINPMAGSVFSAPASASPAPAAARGKDGLW